MGVVNRHSDNMRLWYRHPITIERKVGDAAYGDDDLEYGAPLPEPGEEPEGPPVEEVMARVVERRNVIVEAGAETIVNETRVHIPIETAKVPIGSRVTLPDDFDNKQLHVTSTARKTSGGLPTPDHYTLWLE